uniref:Carboxylic ester hydrolase n=1 Tax=Oreochromis niloticus TaxID=8128 RepID=A0A669C6B5_ORENI
IGISFAAKPGPFEKPKPHPGWDGILKATKFARRCLQINMIDPASSLGSEDSLYLNIWVPHSENGGFMSGDRGDVIIVSVGYRVGTLGFLSTGDSSFPGNYGLWDQHAAIAWVRRNIQSFGGDPDNITLFGESAGGASVCFQTLTPYNKGLIRKAISQSGVGLCQWAYNKNPHKIVAEKVGCPTDESMVACLKSTNAVTLTMILKGPHDIPFYSDPGVLSQLMSSVVDGDFLPDEPGNLFHNAAEIDYLAGVNDMDGRSFTAQDIPSLSDKNKEIPVLLAAYTKKKGEAGLDIAFAEYISNWDSTPSQDTIKRTAVEIGTDYIFLVPTEAAVYLHAANAKSGHTYFCVMSEPRLLAGPNKPYHDWVGADHTDDPQYAFGKLFTTPSAYGQRHRDLSGYMIAYWTNFARTGDPNKEHLTVPVTWPKFTTSGQNYLDINAKMNESSVGKQMRLCFENKRNLSVTHM